jgi:hypothetical protein
MAEAERGAVGAPLKPIEPLALPCRAALAAARAMNMLGVMPQHRLKWRPKWLWSKKPTSVATTDPGTPSSNSVCAR